MTTSKNRNRGLIVGVAVAVAGAYLVGHERARADEDSSAKTTLSSPAAGNNQAPNFSAIVAKYGPAVVHVEARSDEQTSDGGHSGALGTGFIVSQDGYILTNNHVVEGAARVTIKLSDGRKFPAQVIGTDKEGDVAVLKIAGSGFPTVKIGNPADSHVGDWVVAIGSPYGLDNTVTSGIISAKSRTMSEDNPMPFIQTDVPVNPGNSGGPLFNLNGEVIGINSMIYSRTGGFQGLSFAIPIDEAMHIKDQIVGSGHASHARLGVAVQALDSSTASQLGLNSTHGALVAQVEDGSPAQAAGVQQGDVIVALNGQEIATPAELRARVSHLESGANTKLTVLRDGAKRTLTLAASGDAAGNAAPQTRAQSETPRPRLGVAVRQLSDDEAAQIGVDGGVLVARASGPAAAAGVSPGDVILAVNGVEVSNVEQLQQTIADARGKVSIVVYRDGQQLTLKAQLANTREG
ncbi:trypsin-like peptidase domain-containing protein [Paraburkholderia dinghuensis]|uniref:Probable periplasmic serine endoprotease DegP-like n=1 Tax=Paraburkholderia dinghuensis TaxID=2305225 RepID=A0A3N6N304_9BURK|nr:trypsin-like peptidase domain-containing protein [Paraburkholderia dinghuensis]RQH02067.1 PDZ domain-containing protein [Paraburkholderia dinghuensis]